MFMTHPDAELPIPSGLALHGERTWQWVEFSLQIPYFFLSFSVASGNASLMRYILFSQLKDVLCVVSTIKKGVKDIEIDLLSPGYVNGSNSYKMGKVKEIWEGKNPYEQMFVMSDGARLYFPSDKDGSRDQEFELVFSL